MLYNQNKSCVKSCQNIALETIVFQKNPLFSTKKTHCFQHVHFFYPIVLKRNVFTARDAREHFQMHLTYTEQSFLISFIIKHKL